MSNDTSQVLLANVLAAREEQHHVECLQDSYGCPESTTKDCQTCCLPQDRYCDTLLGRNADQASPPLFRLRTVAHTAISASKLLARQCPAGQSAQSSTHGRFARDAREPCVCHAYVGLDDIDALLDFSAVLFL